MYNLDMDIFTVALITYVFGVTAHGIYLIKKNAELAYRLSGYNPNARDGDGDGIIQEGTKWERKLS